MNAGKSLSVACCLAGLAHLTFSLDGAALGAAMAAVVVLSLVIVVRPIASGLTLAGLSYLYLFPVAIPILGTAELRLMSLAWLAVWMGLCLQPRSRPGIRGKGFPSYVLLAAGALLVWQLVSALVAGGRRPLVEFAQLAYLIAIAQTVAIFIAAIPSSRVVRRARFAAYAFLGTLLVSLPGYVSSSLRLPMMRGTPEGGLEFVEYTGASLLSLSEGTPRFFIVGLGPVGTATLCVAAIAMALPLVLDSGVKRKRLSLTVVVSALAALLLSLSRAGWLVAVVVVCLIGFRAGLRRFLTVLLVIAVIAGLALAIPVVRERAADLTNLAEASYLGHASLWRLAIDKGLERPVFGWGPGSFKTFEYEVDLGSGAFMLTGSDAHNLLLQEFAETGIPGVVLLLILIATALWGMKIRWRAARFGLVGPVLAFVGVLLMALTMNIFRTELFWVLLGVGRGIAVRHRARSAGVTVASRQAPAGAIVP